MSLLKVDKPIGRTDDFCQDSITDILSEDKATDS